MTDTDKSAPRARYATGIRGLDEILKGGFLAGSVYIIRGSPGAGKTIVANQICFHSAKLQKHCLYITLLSESHDRLLENIQALDFYTPDLIDQIQYLSGFHVLEEEGLKGILKMMAEETKRYGTGFTVLDGLFALQEKIGSERDFRLFMNQIQNFAHLTGSTILLLTNSDRGHSSPEYTMVDGWLELAVQQHSYRVYRYVQIHKLRGSSFVTGRHSLTISDAGVQVLPRMESMERLQHQRPPSPSRYSTGIEEFDLMIGGGVPVCTNTLLVGATGVGKTALGLHFIAQSTAQEPGLIFGFYEDQDDLIQRARLLGIDALQPALESGALEIQWHSPTEHVIDELGYDLVAAVRRRGVKRLFVDGLDALQQSALHPERTGRFLAAVHSILRAEGVTAMFTLETPELIGGEAKMHFAAVSAVAQNIVLLRYVERQLSINRTISIIKARTSYFDPRIRTFDITSHGVRILPFEDSEKMFAEYAHTGSLGAPEANE